MKKNLFLAALAITALVSCSESDYLGDERPSAVSSNDVGAISFGTGFKAVTRGQYDGTRAADSLRRNFVVKGVKSNGDLNVEACDTVFEHYNVNYLENTGNTTTSNSAGWEYVAQANHAYGPTGAQSIKYWDYDKSQYDFIAYSKGGATAVYVPGEYTAGTNVYITPIDPTKLNGVKENNVITDGAYKIKGQAKDLAKIYIADLVTVYRDGSSTNDAGGDYKKEVEIKFRSLSAKARIGIYETVPGYSVKNVKFYTATNTSPSDDNAYLFTDGNKFNEGGEYVVYFPTTGSTNKTNSDYNKAHLSLISDGASTSSNKSFGSLDEDTYVAKQDHEDTTSPEEKLYIGRASNEATYAGINTNNENHYTTVLPNEEGAELNLKVNYTLLSTDGTGETINVKGASAKVPAVYAQWKSGYAYTYLFKISQNTNGLTNPDINIAGLYPITLDAVVVETTDSIQETITTVADTCITTYSKGQVVTANNEYKTGANIYVIVEGAPALSSSNTRFFTATIEDGAAQTINEASVANVLDKATESSGTWELTDKNGMKLTVTTASGLTYPGAIAAADAPGGNNITVNCAMFNPSTAGNYVFEYTDKDGKKHYKIIKVVE